MSDTIYSYKNFDFTSLSDNTLNVIVLGIIVGIIVGTVFSVLYKTVTSSFIKALVRNNITTPDKAKKIDDLDFIGKWYIKNELKYTYKTLRRYVICANEEELLDNKNNKKEFQKLPVENALFYLPEEKRIEAELRFTGVRKPIGTIILTIILGTAAAYFAIFAIPELLQMLDNFLTSIK